MALTSALVLVVCLLLFGESVENSFFEKKYDRPFEYKKYWERASALALAEQDTGPLPYEPYNSCMKVFIYDMPKSIQGGDLEEILSPHWLSKESFRQTAFDRSYEFRSGQHVAIEMFLYRLFVDDMWKYDNRKDLEGECGYECELERAKKLKERREKGCFLTDDPNEADLFLIPLHLSHPKMGSNTCPNDETFFERQYQTLLAHLPHLNATNTCRHVMMVAQGTYKASTCKPWFAEPKGPFQFMLRVGGTPVFPRNSLPHYFYSMLESRVFEDVPNQYPYLVSTLYPTNIHWSDTFSAIPPWHPKHSTNRTFLMLYTTSNRVHGDVMLRNKILSVCEKYKKISENICQVDVDGTKGVREKENAVFCLEPIGDSPYRKSIFDSLTYGCIPVLFSEMTDGMAPYHWQGWRNRTRVLISRWDIISDRLDLYTLLKSIPETLQIFLQESIGKIGQRFQTSLHYNPGDSQSFWFRGLVDQKKRCEADVSKMHQGWENEWDFEEQRDRLREVEKVKDIVWKKEREKEKEREIEREKMELEEKVMKEQQKIRKMERKERERQLKIIETEKRKLNKNHFLLKIQETELHKKLKELERNRNFILNFFMYLENKILND